MNSNTKWKIVYRLMRVFRQLDQKSSELIYLIDEEGLNDDKDYSSEYEEIGRKFVKLHGSYQGYIEDELSELLEILVLVIKNDWPNIKIDINFLSDLFFGFSEEEYLKQRDKLLINLANDNRIVSIFNGEENLLSKEEQDTIDDALKQDINPSNEGSKGEVTETPKTVSYMLSRDPYELYGIFVPKSMYSFFTLEEVMYDKKNKRELLNKDIYIKYKRTTYRCVFTKTEMGIVLYWNNMMRKSIMKKHPECFDYYDSPNNANTKHVLIEFDRTDFEQDQYYKMTTKSIFPSNVL
jgi:hypothetical protein